MTNTTTDIAVDELGQKRIKRSAVAIRQHIRLTEASGDKLLEDTADLMKAMVSARRQAAAEPHIGQHAIMRLAKAQQAIISAQNEFFRVHDELVKIQTVMMPDESGSTQPSGIADDAVASFEGIIAAA